MKVAVLADIHGNLPALEAVLEDLDEHAPDRIVLLGDIAGGPMPAETLDRLAELGERAVWVHGNGERELVDTYDKEPPTDGERPKSPQQTASDKKNAGTGLMRRRHRDLIAGLPMTVTLDVDGLGPTLFCHATPRKDDEFVLVDSPLPYWTEVLAGVAEQVVVCGHTHMPFDRLVDRRRVVNPGSVGMPYGPPGAHWAILGPTVQLHRTPYDVRAAAARIADSGYPDASAWAEAYVLHTYSDAEALAAFTPLVSQHGTDGPLDG